jgi:hypothetical protein
MGPLIGILLMLVDGFFMGWLNHLAHGWWFVPSAITSIGVFILGLLLLCSG